MHSRSKRLWALPFLMLLILTHSNPSLSCDQTTQKKSRVGLEKGDEVPTPPVPKDKPLTPEQKKINLWTRIIAGEIAQNPDEWSNVLDVLKKQKILSLNTYVTV